jgi:hypothetical protein
LKPPSQYRDRSFEAAVAEDARRATCAPVNHGPIRRRFVERVLDWGAPVGWKGAIAIKIVVLGTVLYISRVVLFPSW